MKRMQSLILVLTTIVVFRSTSFAVDLKFNIQSQVPAINNYQISLLNMNIPNTRSTEIKKYYLTTKNNFVEFDYPHWFVLNVGYYQRCQVKVFSAFKNGQGQWVRGDLIFKIENILMKWTDLEKISFTEKFNCGVTVKFHPLDEKNWAMESELRSNCNQSL